MDCISFVLCSLQSSTTAMDPVNLYQRQGKTDPKLQAESLRLQKFPQLVEN